MFAPTESAAARVLVVGVGNILRGDDGFGPAVIRRLENEGLPEGVRAVELGIGGIGLVQELMEKYDVLIIVDAATRGGEPGTLYLLTPDVVDARTIPEAERHALTTDMHEAVPHRTLVIAAALGVLPPVVRLVGCEPAETDELNLELSPSVQQAVPKAIEAIRHVLAITRQEAVANSQQWPR